MPILTIVTSRWTRPIEAVKVFLDGLQEVAASNNCVRHFSNFSAWVRIQINCHLTLILQRQVMAKLALLALLTNTCLKVWAKRSLFVD